MIKIFFLIKLKLKIVKIFIVFYYKFINIFGQNY